MDPERSQSWGVPPWRFDVRPPERALPARTDVVVVGAGLTGLAAAAALAEAGVRVHVLESAGVGDGASGRTGGLVLEDTAAGPLAGVEGCVDALREVVTRYAIQCHLDLRGCGVVGHGGEPAAGAQRWPDEEAALAVEGRVPGGAVDPGALVSGLAAAVLRAGGAIHEHARVEAWEPGAPLRLRVGGRWLEAERVLLAANAFLPALLPAGVMRPALTLALATEPLSLPVRQEIGLGELPFYTSDVPYLWGRATPAGRLVIGAGLAFDADDDVERVALARSDVRESLERLERRVRGVHPALEDVAITHRWGGPIAFRSGLVPLFAEVAPGVLAAGAYAGHGVALSVRLGGLAAAWLREGGSLPSWGRLALPGP